MSDEAKDEVVKVIRTPVQLEYSYSAGRSASRFLRSIKQGKLIGQKCPVDGRVYFPSRGSCPQHGVPIEGDPVELADIGTLVTFSIVRIPADTVPLDIPFVTIQVLLDGADTILMHLLSNCDLEKVHMGMRLKAVWKPKEEWEESVANIIYFEPLDEPDADYDSYKEHI
ncbi:MAG: Zn-ribbon domain-containing OB-fold protein [Candidatus Binatia bacterium]|nr:Zn-ribbon domain-containing OB-fold protein [Candidatus Binatia bacterium]